MSPSSHRHSDLSFSFIVENMHANAMVLSGDGHLITKLVAS